MNERTRELRDLDKVGRFLSSFLLGCLLTGLMGVDLAWWLAAPTAVATLYTAVLYNSKKEKP